MWIIFFFITLCEEDLELNTHTVVMFIKSVVGLVDHYSLLDPKT